MKDVIAFVEGSGTLPEKPIVLTFDDGHYNNYYYAHDLLRKYNAKAVISIVGETTEMFSDQRDDNPSYSYVTWDHIKKMHRSGLWEIQNHSYECHSYDKRKGVSRTYAETDREYEKFLMSDLRRLQDMITCVTGTSPDTFTYPFGAFSENTDEILRKIGFKATLSCTEGINTIKTGDPDCLYRLNRYLRPPEKSPEDFFTFLQ